MKNIYRCPLFKDIPEPEVDLLLNGIARMKHYAAGEIVAIQGTQYKSLLIIDDGMVRGEMTNNAGDVVVIEEIAAPRIIAPAFIFASDNRLPVNVVAVSSTDMVSIALFDFMHMLQNNSQVLTNFIRSMSDRSKFLSDRVRMLRFGTIKSKLASYLLEQRDFNGTDAFMIPHTHQELADMFGVTRPALSRALGQLMDEGGIEGHKNQIRIVNKQILLDYTN